jgi:Leucine-rich repeat (LRR) protein
MDKNDNNFGNLTGLPMHRYQWHFQDQQFMDIHDRQMDWIGFLNGEGAEMKQFFKPEIMKNLSGPTGNSVVVEYPRDATSKYIALYGFDEFFESLPKTLQRFDFTSSGNNRYGEQSGEVNLELPEKIGDYDNLEVLHLDGVINKLPSSIGKLKKLQFLSLPNNKNLQELPESVADLPSLMVLNLKNSNPNIKIPKRVQDKIDNNDIHIVK